MAASPQAPDGEHKFDESTVEVRVADGRLTLAPGPGADNAKICFIEVRSLGASTAE